MHGLIGQSIKLPVVKDVEHAIRTLLLSVDLDGDVPEVFGLQLQQVDLIDQLRGQLIHVEHIGLIVLKFLQVVLLLQLVLQHRLPVLARVIVEHQLQIYLGHIF